MLETQSSGYLEKKADSGKRVYTIRLSLAENGREAKQKLLSLNVNEH